MINAILVCTQGMSTNIMKAKIEEYANKVGTEINICAVGLDELDNHLKNLDIIILGPQIKYAESMVREQVDKVDPNIKLMCIKPADFGMMRGDLVYKQMMGILEG